MAESPGWQPSRQIPRRQAALGVLLLAIAACEPGARLPSPGSDEYRQAVAAFYTGLAAMEVSADAHAEEEFLRVTELAPTEPAAWTNLGLLALRRNELDVAGQRLERAASLAPENSAIPVLLAVVAGQQGRSELARAHLERAIEVDSANVKAIFALAQELQRGAEGGADEAQAADWLRRILELRPDNLAVEVELARLAVKRGEPDRIADALARLAADTERWPEAAREQFDSVQAAVAAGDPRRAARRLSFLRNVLARTDAFRDDLAAVQSPEAEIGEPLESFLRLAPPTGQPAATDADLRFAFEAAMPAPEPAAWVGTVELGLDAPPAVMAADGREVRIATGVVLPFPGGPYQEPPEPTGVLSFDFDNDHLSDLALAGAGGFRLFRQDTSGAFSDVTAATGLGVDLLDGPLSAVWALDVDLEGDLDLLVSGHDGSRLLRNNGDGSFTELSPLIEGAPIRDLVWADLDGDAIPDVALIDGRARLRVLINERQARFAERSLPDAPRAAMAVAAADLDRDGVTDLLVMDADGTLRMLTPGPDPWEERASAAVLARWPNFVAGGAADARVFAVDLDNNGALDAVAFAAGQTRGWLQDSTGYRGLGEPLGLQLFEVVEAGTTGHPSLIGLGAGNRPTRVTVAGSRGYGWVRLRPRAAERAGDQRINSYGLGGVVELRSGLLYQRRPIAGPTVHFGLGERTGANVARLVWPNGVVQAEFDLAANETIRPVQRLKGSCPWVFAFDGSRMRFVTDFIWRSPLGMQINAQQAARIATTEDWVLIRGDQLQERDGYYEVRITAELWETHFFDHISLRVVDHPPGTEAFVDERFALPPPEMTVHVTGPVRPLAAARDDRGNDVGGTLAARDERYVDSFGLGPYQGVTRDHFVELELGAAAADAGPIWLVASGWTRPTDSSINVAIGQGEHAPPDGLRLEVPDGKGGWRVARDGLGFPAGKSKTVLIDLSEIVTPQGPHRLRLATNLEVYWDRIGWARQLPEADRRVRRLDAETARLRYRGFSKVEHEGLSSPEYPDYDQLAGTAPRWLDLEGYHTRFGDVRELLREVDDRYVIMNAGDEIVLRFPAAPPPPAGWRRDFALAGDGWVKDGDYNTNFSRTVGPLPSHDDAAYAGPRLPLAEDPMYREHASDWVDYHTRYVGPRRIQRALVPRSPY